VSTNAFEKCLRNIGRTREFEHKFSKTIYRLTIFSPRRDLLNNYPFTLFSAPIVNISPPNYEPIDTFELAAGVVVTEISEKEWRVGAIWGKCNNIEKMRPPYEPHKLDVQNYAWDVNIVFTDHTIRTTLCPSPLRSFFFNFGVCRFDVRNLRNETSPDSHTQWPQFWARILTVVKVAYLRHVGRTRTCTLCRTRRMNSRGRYF